MNVDEIILNSINKSTREVFSTMLGVEIEPGDAAVCQKDPQEETDGSVVSFIGLAGSWTGTGCITCTPAQACRVCSLMLMTDSTAVDEEVLDAVAELTNMIVGNVKTDLEAALGPLGLSVPAVVFGRNFKTKTAATTQWVVVRFQWEGEAMVVKICLAPSEKTVHHVPHALDHACSLNV